MKLGVTLFAQNYQEWDRFEALERGDSWPEPSTKQDSKIWDEQKELGDLIEPLGYDSIWSVEHHFTPYTMVTNVLQHLTYWAGRTESVGLGSMIAVMPWHNPVRLAEEIVMLQHLAGDRQLKIGIGRGAGRREFGGLGVPMGESRERFLETLEIVRLALTEERFSYDGTFFQIPDVSQRPESPTISLRPRPRNLDVLDSLYCSWGSPETGPIAAKAGLRPLIIPQKAFESYEAELENFDKVRVEAGHGPARPGLVVWVYCADTAEKAEEGARRYVGEYVDSALRHYEINGSHFKDVGGYDHYAQAAKAQKTTAETTEVYLNDHIWGTPDQCIERLKVAADSMRPDEFIAVMSYGSMPLETAKASMRLFADEVLPFVHELGD